MDITSDDLDLAARRLCLQHLLGNHGELHKHRHVFVRQHSITGRLGQIEPLAMQTWHDALARELLRRGYRHESPYTLPPLDYLPLKDRLGRVDRETALENLTRRCAACRERIFRLNAWLLGWRK
jgi:hypothetical protein